MPPSTMAQPTSWITATKSSAKRPPIGSSGARPKCSAAEVKNSRASALSKVSSAQPRAVCIAAR